MDFHLILEALGLIVIPFVIWLFNIQKEHQRELDELKEGMTNKAKESFQTVFKRIDEIKDYSERTYVREAEYKIHREYQEKDVDQKFKSLMTTMTTQFQNVEDKIDELKDALKEKNNGH